MLNRVRRYMEQYGMLEPGDRVIVALSGGADSVSLLMMLHEIAPELPVFLRAVHVNHGLRGREADQDEEFVKELCLRLCIPFMAVHCDVKGLAQERGLSEEEAGRDLRYEIFEKAAADWDKEAGGVCAAKIAVAHHAGDNTETILHNLVRGSGLKGLSGIKPVNGRRIRPLLCADRGEIRDWLLQRGEVWCEDSTNQSCDYTRNRIRNQILPLMESLINIRAAEHICSAGAIIGQADAYLERQAQKVWDEASRAGSARFCLGAGAAAQDSIYTGQWMPAADEGISLAQINLDVFRQQDEIIRIYLLRHMLEMVAPGRKNMTYCHFKQLDGLAHHPVGSRICLPAGVRGEVGYDVLRIIRDREEYGIWSGRGEGGKSGAMEKKLQMRKFLFQKDAEIPKNQYTKWFDYDRIKNTLSVRTRREGDYLTLPGGGHKTVSRYMIDEKIPREQRDKILLLVEGSHVLWVVGHRISEYYKITDDTETILQVTYDGGENHGR